jgi:hypothetical protein
LTQYGKFAIACQIKFSPAIAEWLELADKGLSIPINNNANSDEAKGDMILTDLAPCLAGRCRISYLPAVFRDRLSVPKRITKLMAHRKEKREKGKEEREKREDRSLKPEYGTRENNGLDSPVKPGNDG